VIYVKLAVTGGLGFIGSNFIEYAMKEHTSWQVLNIDKETYAANKAYLSQFENSSRYELIKGDISVKSEIEKSLQDVDIIVNFAAESHVDRSIDDSSAFVFSNYVGVKNLLEIATERGIRFHQVSTDEVFGSLPLNSIRKFNEETKYDPKNPYSATKAAADHLTMAFHNTYGTKVTISYSGNNFGPHQHSEKLIPKTILSLYTGKKVPIYGNGLQKRDWVYVQDHCSAIDHILMRARSGEKYVISSGTEKTNLEIVNKIAQIMNIRGEVVEHVRDRLGHDVRYSSDPKLIMNKLGWKPKYDFDNALMLTVDHYINNIPIYSENTN
jgi:dTDP-glucose 4,6-dehydratase